MTDLTLITVTYNAASFIDRTLESVKKAAALLPGNFALEYLVIDGASGDDTLHRVSRYPELAIRAVSEPDRGLYDAMNKGLRMARGRYVWFLNAGDEIYDETTLLLLAEAMQGKADVYYSDALFIAANGDAVGLRSRVTPHRLPAVLTWQEMALGMKVCHQAFITKKEIAPPYDTDNLSADLDWEITILKRAKEVVYMPAPLCRYLLGGVSVQKHRRSLLDRWKVLQRHFGTLGALWNHLRIGVRGMVFLVRKGRYW